MWQRPRGARLRRRRAETNRPVSVPRPSDAFNTMRTLPSGLTRARLCTRPYGSAVSSCGCGTRPNTARQNSTWDAMRPAGNASTTWSIPSKAVASSDSGRADRNHPPRSCARWFPAAPDRSACRPAHARPECAARPHRSAPASPDTAARGRGPARGQHRPPVSPWRRPTGHAGGSARTRHCPARHSAQG